MKNPFEMYRVGNAQLCSVISEASSDFLKIILSYIDQGPKSEFLFSQSIAELAY